MGGTLKIKFYEEKTKSTFHGFTLEVPSLNQRLSFSKGKKITKPVNKNSQVTASLYTTKFTNLSILGFTINKCTFVPTKHNMPEPIVL